LDPSRVKNVELHLMQTGSGALPASYSMGIAGLFPGGKAAEANHSPPTSAQDKENVDLYIHSPICLHGVVLNYLSTVATLPYLTKTI
jgi:hypothetical protein